MKKNRFTLTSVLIAILMLSFIGCDQPSGSSGDNNSGGGSNIPEPPKESVTLNLFNESSFKVDIYKNINPSASDTSTKPLTSIAPGEIVKLKQVPSVDQTIGDVFYVRYYVQLADAFESGVEKALDVPAMRDLSNISVVLVENKSYTRVAAQPSPGQLRFDSGFLKVTNTGQTAIQVLHGTSILTPLGDTDVNLAAGNSRYYSIDVNSFEEETSMNSLHFQNTSTAQQLTADEFTLKRGMLYSFSYTASAVTKTKENALAY